MKEKTLFLTLLLGTFVSISSFAQKDLDRNRVFFELAKKSIEYPRTGISSSMYGRIYAKFTVSKSGKVENIEVFYPKMNPDFEKSVGFGASIKRGLKKLPLLGLGYAGEYVLPIAFVFTNYSETPKLHYPSNVLPEFIKTDNMTILTEIKITGKSNSHTPESTPPSQQIAQ